MRITSTQHTYPGKSWDALPVACKTLEVQSEAFCLLAAAGCEISHLADTHSKFPFKTFGLLVEPERIAAEIAATPRCVRDAWTNALVDDYHPHDLGCPDCLADIRSIATLAQEATCAVEASHASIRRCLYVQSCQTHSAAFGRVAAEWCLRRVRASQVSSSLDPRRKHRPKAKRDESSAPGPGGAGGAGDPGAGRGPRAHRQGSRRKGAGGAWRAFIRESTSGCNGRADFRSLAEAYKTLSAAEKLRLEARGRDATAAARARAPEGTSAFGPTPREVAAGVRKRRREAAVEEAVRFEHAAMRRIGDVVPVVAQPSQALLPSGETAWKQLFDLRGNMVVERQARERVRQESERALQQWSLDEDGGQASLAVVIGLGPDQAARRDEFNPLPDASGLEVLQWRPCMVAQRAKSALQLNRRSTMCKWLMALLDELWARATAVVQHGRVEAIDDRPVQRKLCCEAGFCVCRVGGLFHVQCIHVNFAKAVRKAFKKRTGPRNLLDRHRVVVLLKGEALQHSGEGGEEPAYEVMQQSWLHIGYKHLAKGQFNFLELKPAGART